MDFRFSRWLVTPTLLFCVSGAWAQSTNSTAAQSIAAPRTKAATGDAASGRALGADRQTLGDNLPQKEDKDGWDKAAVLSNYLLVIVGIGGIVIAVCTLQKIERQIKAAEADTEATARAERAWIVISVESTAPNQFNLIATNTGRIPADVKSIWATGIITKRGEVLQIPPDEKTRESLMNTPPCLIPPTASQIVFRCNIEEMDRQGAFGRNVTFSQGFAELRFYGRILYSDILNSDTSVPHETKWLYWQVPIQGALPFPDPMHLEHNTYR